MLLNPCALLNQGLSSNIYQCTKYCVLLYNVYRLPVIPTKAASLISIPFPVSLFLFCLRFFWLEAVAKPARQFGHAMQI